jgi:hypothetical protein
MIKVWEVNSTTLGGCQAWPEKTKSAVESRAFVDAEELRARD